VGFIVQPSSREITFDAQGAANCESDRPIYISDAVDNQVVYTYSVEWRVPDPPVSVLTRVSSTRLPHGLQDGINISMYLILEFTGSVSSIQPSSSSFSLEW
jgi:hypothetical protein